MSAALAWEHELQSWLEPFLKPLRHPARRRMCPLYVAGLIGPGERKSLQPLAARVAPADYDQLHHFVAVGPWDEAPLEAELLARPIGWRVGQMPSWSSTTRPCPRRARIPWALPRNMPAPWARRRTARRWSRSLWPKMRCPSRSACACFCPIAGSTI